MAEIKITCPKCAQHIQCDELWAGHQINCPICQAPFVVPQPHHAPPPAPAASTIGKQLVPPPTHGGKLSAGSTQVARSSLGAAGPTSAYKAPQVKRQNPILKYVAIVFVVVALAGAGWYIATYMGWIGKKDAAPTQEETLAAEKKNAAAGDGGGDQSSQPPAAPTNAPMVAPVWSLNPKGVKISDGKANGTISGANFVVENARLTKTASGHLLSLSEGSGPSPNHEFQVFLRLGATDSVTNHTWSITPEMTGASVAPVVKRWKTDPRFAPQSKTFSSGYALQLEMGTPGEDGQIPGKIFLSLPDQEQSVVAGTFKATSTIVQAVQQQQPAEVTQPAAGMDPAMRRRYNLK